ncbi:MAG: TonB-dependent receptor [Bacteroidota bacterium]|nr:TonB-dependent receptor [Bacteroidota bacterium]
MRRKLYFLLVVAMFTPVLLFAGTQGKIRGKVVDGQTGEPLIGAAVVVVGTSLGSTTDVSGEFSILRLDAGTYQVRASYIGYQSVTISNIRVNSDLTTDANFKLSAQGVTVGTVEIVAERPLINKSATNSVRIIDGEAITALPTRGVDALIRLEPGVVQQGGNVFVRGSRPDQTSYQIDGVSVNNLLAGGRGLTITDAAIEQIQVQSGGYPAEYSGANGGIITSTIKTGREGWKFSLLGETDNFTSQGKKSLGTYSYGYSDYTATFGGPVVSDKVRFFGAVQNTFFRDPNVINLAGLNFSGANGLPTSAVHSAAHPNDQRADTINLIVPAGNVRDASLNTFVFTGSLLYNLQNFQVKASGSVTTQEQKTGVTVGNFANFLNSSRLPLNTLDDGFANIKFVHFITPTANYEISGNMTWRDTKGMDPALRDNLDAYGDSSANAKIGYNAYYFEPLINRYQAFEAYDIYGGTLGLNQPGVLASGYNKTSVRTYGAKFDFTSQLAKVHTVKLGGEYTQGTVRSYAATVGQMYNRYRTMTDTTKTLEQKAKDLRTSGVENYGYDVFGTKEIDNAQRNSSGGLTDFGAMFPLFIGAYLQDKIEMSDVNINIGLRYDYIDNGGKKFVDPTSLGFDPTTGLIKEASFKKADVSTQISPRLGFSFPVTDQTVFHAQYGQFISPTRGNDSYRGLSTISNNIKGGFFVANVPGYNLKPERSTLYEIGFQQQLSDVASFDLTTYYKDIRDQITFTQIVPKPGAEQSNYGALVNGDYATTKGVEFKVTLRRVERVQASVNYTFSDARATGSNPTQLAGTVAGSKNADFTPKFVFPTTFNQPHKGSVSVDYRFAKNDGGPILERLGLNMLMQFNSGNAFTRLKIEGQGVGDGRFRSPIELIGSSSTPWVFYLDAKLDKMIEFGSIDVNFYIYIQNLLNFQNAIGAYPRTGDARDDGWLSEPAGKVKAQQLGAQYSALYSAITNTNSQNFDTPRQIRFGVKIDYK